jgi:mannose-6-phosphate isomerase-like protein (cupin superfamily)
MRRVVTGNKNGKSIILEDSDISPQEEYGFAITRLWGTRGVPVVPAEEVNLTKQLLAYGFPQIGETRIQIFVITPEKENIEKYGEKDLVDFWRKIYGDDLYMHTTDTVDYAIILSGEISMELDNGVEIYLKPGDCVVQNGTRHAWRNHGSEKCVAACFLIGAKRTTTEYIDTVNKFTFKYNDTWTKNTAAITETTLAFVSSARAKCPGIVVRRFPESDAPTLKALLPRIFGAKASPVTSTDEKITNTYGIVADAHVLEYTAPNGNQLHAKVYGFRSGGFWWVMYIYQSPQLGTLEGVLPDEIFNTWRLG